MEISLDSIIYNNSQKYRLNSPTNYSTSEYDSGEEMNLYNSLESDTDSEYSGVSDSSDLSDKSDKGDKSDKSDLGNKSKDKEDEEDNVGCNNNEKKEEYDFDATINLEEPSLDISESQNIHSLVYNPSEEIKQETPCKNKNKNGTPRIVASLTCTYNGLSHLKQTLMSLHDQEFDCIYLNVPGHYFSNSKDLIPEWMKICCEVIFCQDIGPILKLLPVLDIETDPSTIIVTVENGVVYPKNMAKVYLQAFKKNIISAYANSVYKFKSINYFQPIIINNNVGDIFESSNGVGYLRSFFRNDIKSYISFLSKSEQCLYSDNLLIINYLQKYKINIRCLTKKNYNANLIKYSLRKDLLYTNSGLNFKIVYKYYLVIQILQKNNILYLKNPRAILDNLRYLVNRPYNVPFNY